MNAGAMHIDPSGFNQFLPEGFPQLSGDFLSIGGDGYFMYENFVIGGGGQGLIGEELIHQGQITRIGGGMGFFHFGYDFVHKETLKVYPLIGIGGGGFTMEFSTLGQQSKSEVLQKNTDGSYLQSNISFGSVMLDLGVGLDFFPESGTDSSPRLGIRLGYQFAPSHGDFRYGGGRITGADLYSLSGYYFRIIIGGGGFGKMQATTNE